MQVAQSDFCVFLSFLVLNNWPNVSNAPRIHVFQCKHADFNQKVLSHWQRCHNTQVKVLHLWILDSAIIYYRNCKRNYFINNSYFRILGSINSTVLGQWTVKWVQVNRDLIKDHEIFNFFSSSQSEFHTLMLMKLIGHVRHRREIIIIPQCLVKCGLAQQDDWLFIAFRIV